MKPVFSLAQLTTLNLSPPEMVSLAHRTGFDLTGVRLLPSAPGGVAYPLMDNPVMLRETLARMEDTGIQIFDLEMIRIDPQFNVTDYLPFMEVGARLGAKAILVAGDEPDEARMIDQFALLCDTAYGYGLTSDLEFMPWTVINNVNSAARIVGAANRPGGGVLVDALHFARSDSSLEDLAALPRAWLHYAQMCDGPLKGPSTREGLIHAARSDRLLPGEGALDIAGIFRRLPADLPISLEVPSDRRLPDLGPDLWAREVLTAGQLVAGKFR
jgi:sugar phosphate isomerase/epimerase